MHLQQLDVNPLKICMLPIQMCLDRNIYRKSSDCMMCTHYLQKHIIRHNARPPSLSFQQAYQGSTSSNPVLSSHSTMYIVNLSLMPTLHQNSTRDPNFLHLHNRWPPSMDRQARSFFVSHRHLRIVRHRPEDLWHRHCFRRNQSLPSKRLLNKSMNDVIGKR